MGLTAVASLSVSFVAAGGQHAGGEQRHDDADGQNRGEIEAGLHGSRPCRSRHAPRDEPHPEREDYDGASCGFLSIPLIQMPGPAELVAERAVVALPASFDQFELWFGPDHPHPIVRRQSPQRPAIDHDRRSLARLRYHHFVHAVGRIDDRPDRERMRGDRANDERGQRLSQDRARRPRGCGPSSRRAC